MSNIQPEPGRVAAEHAPSQGVPSPQRTSKRALLGIFLLVLGNGAATLTPPLVGLPIVIARLDPEGKASSLGLALGLYALLQMALAPVFGALSDRTTGRLGMRKPGLIVGAVVVVSSLLVQGTAQSIAVIVAGVALMGVGTAIFTASFWPLIPDNVPAHARGRVMGGQSLMLVVAGATMNVVGPLLIENQLAVFGVGALVLVPAVLLSLVLLPNRVLRKEDRPARSLGSVFVEGYRFDPRSAPDFSWVWLSRFLVTLGVAFGGAFTVYFMTDQLGVSDDELPGLISTSGLVGIAGVILGTLVGSVLSDRVRERKNLVLVSALILAAGGVTAAFAPNVTVFLVALAVMNFGAGTFLPTDGALVIDVLPGGDKQVGKFMSLITIADQLPRSIGPFIAPVIIAVGATTPLGGYPLVYLLAGVTAIGGGLVVRRVRARTAAARRV